MPEEEFFPLSPDWDMLDSEMSYSGYKTHEELDDDCPFWEFIGEEDRPEKDDEDVSLGAMEEDEDDDDEEEDIIFISDDENDNMGSDDGSDPSTL